MLLDWFLPVVCRRGQLLVGVTGLFTGVFFRYELPFLVEGLNEELSVRN
jgi:hypothetical protein